MQFNVAQQLRGPIGSTKTYDIECAVSHQGDNGPIAVRGSLSMMRTDRGILVQGTLTASVRCACVRCLVQFDRSVDLDIEEEYFPIGDLSAGSAQETLEAEGLVISTGHLLDLEPTIREYAILSTPMKPLCREGCAGLCPTCGATLNDGQCSCAESAGDGPGTAYQLLSQP